MTVGVDHELETCLPGRACVHVGQIESVGLRVDLEERSRLERLLDHALDIDRCRLALADLAVRDVPDAGDVRVLHCRQHTARRVLVEARVNGRDDPLSRRQLLVCDVEVAVGADVHLDPLDDPERNALLQRVDRLGLTGEQISAQPLRVIADRVVLVALLDGACDHRLQRVLAVGPGRVRVQVAADVRELDELRQLPLARRLELAAVLAQLRRDPVVAEEAVDLVFGRERVHLAALDLRDPVLGDREPAADGGLTQRHVVVLRAGEVLEQVAVRFGRHDP